MKIKTVLHGLATRAFVTCGLTAVALISGCGGGATPPDPGTPPLDSRETSVVADAVVRWQGDGLDGIGIAAITPATDGGLWVTGTEGGLAGRPFLRKIGGTSNPCGGDGMRYLSEITTRFERRQAVNSMTTVKDGQFFIAFTGPGTVFVSRFDETTCAWDTDFGAQGVMSVPIKGLVTVTGIKLMRHADDGVLLAVIIPGQMQLRRLTIAGTWDDTFGDSGLATNPNADSFWLAALAVAANGNILASGAVSIPVAFQPAVLKLDAQGRAAESFGTGGVARYPQMSLGTGNVAAMLIEPARIVFTAATGASVASSDFVTNDSVVAAVDLQTGQLLPSFGTSGFLRWDWGYNNSESIGPLVPNGRGGYTACGTVLKSLLLGYSASLVDVTTNGQPDNDLPNQGRRLIAGTGNAGCADMVRMPDGRLAVAVNDHGGAAVMFFNH